MVSRRIRAQAELAAEPINRPERFAEMSEDEQRALLSWIAERLAPARRAGSSTSYGLKHEFADSECGFYVTNGEFKGAMRAAGYAALDESLVNWKYRYRMRKPGEMEPGLFWNPDYRRRAS